jgi:hypothetical protein
MVWKGLPGKDSVMFFEICYLELGGEHRQDVCYVIVFGWAGSFEKD